MRQGKWWWYRTVGKAACGVGDAHVSAASSQNGLFCFCALTNQMLHELTSAPMIAAAVCSIYYLTRTRLIASRTLRDADAITSRLTSALPFRMLPPDVGVSSASIAHQQLLLERIEIQQHSSLFSPFRSGAACLVILGMYEYLYKLFMLQNILIWL